jgi:hypothetical protein
LRVGHWLIAGLPLVRIALKGRLVANGGALVLHVRIDRKTHANPDTLATTIDKPEILTAKELRTRRFLHWNVTEHPTAQWTVQQFRACLTGDEPYQFIIHDRDSIYFAGRRRAISSMELRVLKTPARVPQANAFGERLIGTARRECLDQVIPLNERYLLG